MSVNRGLRDGVGKGLLHPDNRSLLTGIGIGAVALAGLAYWYYNSNSCCEAKGKSDSCKTGTCSKTGTCPTKTVDTSSGIAGNKTTAACPVKGTHASATRSSSDTNKITTVSLPGSEDRIKRYKDLHLQKWVDIKKAALHDYRNNTLEYNTLVDIQNLAIELTVKDVPQILKVNRESRRKVMDTNKKEYARIVKQGIDDINMLYTQNLDEILRDFGVSKDTYSAAVDVHARTDQTVRITSADVLEIVVGQLESFNQPRETTHEYFANLYRDTHKRLAGVSLLAVDPELASEIRAHLILDTVQRETGLEEEDIKHYRQKYDSPELRAIDEEIATSIQQSKSK